MHRLMTICANRADSISSEVATTHGLTPPTSSPSEGPVVSIVIPWRMAMTLRLTAEETEALRRRAELEGRSMQEVAREAVRDYVEQTSRRELIDRVLDEELPRFAEALERLGQ